MLIFNIHDFKEEHWGLSSYLQNFHANYPFRLEQRATLSMTNSESNVKYFLREKGCFVISTDPDCVDSEAVLEFLRQANWWTELTRETLERALRSSLCFSVLESGRQVGMARVITDYATYAYLCDVYIERERRRQGLGSWLVRSILEHPDLRHLKRVALITHDAQSFYLGLGFRFQENSHHYMERRPQPVSSSNPKP